MISFPLTHTHSLERLPSLKPKRDLTLGGVPKVCVCLASVSSVNHLDPSRKPSYRPSLRDELRRSQ